MWSDLRVAIRGFLRTPGFTATAVTTLALCLGATLTIFSVIDSVLLRALPFPAADRLVAIYNTYPNADVLRDGASPTNYYERRGTIRAFEGVSLYKYGSAIVGASGATRRDDMVRVTADFFQTLGTPLAHGRSFREEEMNRGSDDVVIITDAMWREDLAAAPNVVGQTLRVDGGERTIVGVLPPSFRFLSSKARFFVPYATSVEQRLPQARHSGTNSEMIARLRPGVSLAEAQRELDAQDRLLAPTYQQAEIIRSAGFHSVMLSLHDDHVAAVRPQLLLLQGAVLLLVLIGTVNLVNLLLIRTSAKARELAIRRSMGATPRNMVRQVLTETLALSAAGAGAGLALAAAGTRALGVFGVDQLPLGATIEFGWRTAWGAVASTIVLGVLLAIPIIWFVLHAQPAIALRSESRGGTVSRGVQRLRHGFVVAQVSLAFVLLSGAGLLGVSLDRAMKVSPGYRPDHAISGELTLPTKRYTRGDSVTAFGERLMQRIRERPGVVAVGAGTNIPLTGRDIVSAVTVVGYVPRPGESLHAHFAYAVMGDYFAALGIPLKEGRLPTAEELRRGDRVAIVDEDFARRYWPGRSALGERVHLGSAERPSEEAMTIVGVVGAVKQASVTSKERQGAVYLPFKQNPDNSIFVVVRTQQSPLSFASTFASLVRSVDPDSPADEVRTLEAQLSDSLVARRSPALLAALFAAVALVLAAVGTYGVLSYAVSQRRREIGVRLALGAQPRQVSREYVSLGAGLLGVGTLVGVAGAWGAGRVMQRMLFDVPPLHLPTLLASAATMALVAMAASVIPARRAARVDPMVVLSE